MYITMLYYLIFKFRIPELNWCSCHLCCAIYCCFWSNVDVADDAVVCIAVASCCPLPLYYSLDFNINVRWADERRHIFDRKPPEYAFGSTKECSLISLLFQLLIFLINIGSLTAAASHGRSNFFWFELKLVLFLENNGSFSTKMFLFHRQISIRRGPLKAIPQIQSFTFNE